MKQTLLDLRHPHPHRVEVWLNRPKLRNAFNDELIAELTGVFKDINRNPEVRVVLLAAHGSVFCAGADLNWMRAMADYTWVQNRADAQKLADMLWTLAQCPAPIVGRLQGDCYGGGMGLAALCDVLIASDNVQFCLSEARLGLMPATISPYVIRAMGEQAARRYIVTAESFDAGQAKAMGLVHEVCTPQQLDTQVEAILAALLANGPQAMRACKRLVCDIAGQPISERLRADTARRIANIRTSAEGREGVQAFLSKRKPNWSS